MVLEPCAARTASVAHHPPLDRQASWHQCLTECQRVEQLVSAECAQRMKSHADRFAERWEGPTKSRAYHVTSLAAALLAQAVHADPGGGEGGGRTQDRARSNKAAYLRTSSGVLSTRASGVNLMSVPQVSTTTAPTTSSSKTLGRAATTTWAYKPSCQIYVVGARTWTVPTCRRASRPWTQPTNSQPSLWVLSCSDLDTRGRVAPSVALNSVPVAPNEERTWTHSPQTGKGEEVDLPLQVAQWSWLRGQLVPHTTIALNKNLAARLQRDNGHEGPSVGTALGFFTGGELRYWPGNGDEVQCWFKLYLPRESNKNMITMGKPPAVDMKEHFVAVSCMLGCGLLLLHV